jgi:ferredoxin-NADP reductase
MVAMKLHLSQLIGDIVTFDSQVEEREGVATFHFLPNKRVKWEPGQYYVFILPQAIGDPRMPIRPFTVSAAPSERGISITTRIPQKSSRFKQQLLQLQKGNKVYLAGPYGFFTPPKVPSSTVFIAGGIGVTPFRSMIVEYAKQARMPDITLLYASRESDPVFLHELQSIAAMYPSLRIKHVSGDVRIDASYIRTNVEEFAKKDFMISGPKPMVEAMSGLLKTELHIAAGQIHRDSFKGYPWPLN